MIGLVGVVKGFKFAILFWECGISALIWLIKWASSLFEVE